MKVIKVDKNLFPNNLKINKEIEYWYLLLDSNDIPIKEIAFNKSKEVVYKAPFSNIYGLFVDSAISFEDPKQYESIDDSVFMKYWSK